MISLFLKSLIGAILVLCIALFSKSRNFFVAGLVPLFPSFTLIAHYMVGTERSASDLQATALFGVWAMAPYLVYLLAVYYLSTRLALVPVLLCATAGWTIGAVIVLAAWSKFHG
jgi:membrane protein GlpM